MNEEEKKPIIQAARALIRRAAKGALGTHDLHGFPLVTLVAFATLEDGAPLLLLSRIAGHTQNIARDRRVSLLIEGSQHPEDPMRTERITLLGSLIPLEEARREEGKRLFTQRHPGAEPYDTELDFSYFRLELDHARFNQGFGAFTRLRASDLIIESE